MRFLFVDRIIDSNPGKHISGLKHVTAKDYYLLHKSDNHFYFMPSLIGETLGQLAAWNVMQKNEFTFRPVAGVVSRVNFFRPVSIGETLELQARIDRLDDAAVLYQAVASVNGETVLSIDNALGPLLPMETFIDPSMAKAQFTAISPNNTISKPPEGSCADLQPTSISLVPDFEQLIECVPQKRLIMRKTIDAQAPFFPDHFPKKPVLPMTMLLESCLSMAQRFFALSAYPNTWHLRALQRVKMNEFVHPEDTVQTTLSVKCQDEKNLTLLFKTEREDARVCVMEAIFENREIHDHTT